MWLPTRAQMSEFAGPATASVLAARFISKHTSSATIAATGYLRGLPPGHTAASNIWIAHCNSYLPARSCALACHSGSHNPSASIQQTDRNQTSNQQLLKLDVTTKQKQQSTRSKQRSTAKNATGRAIDLGRCATHVESHARNSNDVS